VSRLGGGGGETQSSCIRHGSRSDLLGGQKQTLLDRFKHVSIAVVTKAARTSGTSVIVYQTTRRNNPVACHLQVDTCFMTYGFLNVRTVYTVLFFLVSVSIAHLKCSRVPILEISEEIIYRKRAELSTVCNDTALPDVQLQ
jgi:hypothetical protein